MMSGSSAKRLLLCLAIGLVVLVVILAWLEKPSLSLQPEKNPPRADLIRTGGADEPVREITPDHRVARIRHKDSNGYLPLEYVETPVGRVTVQRTFSLDGKMIKEEAFLAGKPVPVPAR
jgi:hypothetical protein